MMRSLSGILDCRAKIDTEDFQIKEILLSIEDRKLAYIVLDAWPWFDNHHALVSAELITRISTTKRSLTLRASRDDVENAPVVCANGLPTADRLPPVLVGYFGSVTPPPGMEAAESDQYKRRYPRRKTGGNPFQRYSAILGMDVLGKDGHLGVAKDLFVRLDTMELTALRVSNKRQSADWQILVPSEKLRRLPVRDTHLVLDVTSNELADAPRLGTGRSLDTTQLARLRQYYQ